MKKRFALAILLALIGIALVPKMVRAQLTVFDGSELASDTLTTGCECGDASTPLPTNPKQTLCTLASVPVTISVGGGDEGPRVTFSYSLWGNALDAKHSGVTAWVSFDPAILNSINNADGQDLGYIAVAALAPSSIARQPGGSWIGGSGTVDLPQFASPMGPLSVIETTIQLNVAFDRKFGRQQWGCPASVIPVASFLRVENDGDHSIYGPH